MVTHAEDSIAHVSATLCIPSKNQKPPHQKTSNFKLILECSQIFRHSSRHCGTSNGQSDFSQRSFPPSSSICQSVSNTCMPSLIWCAPRPAPSFSSQLTSRRTNQSHVEKRSGSPLLFVFVISVCNLGPLQNVTMSLVAVDTQYTV